MNKSKQNAIFGLSCFPCIALVTYKWSCFPCNVQATDPCTDMMSDIEFLSINLIPCFHVREEKHL